MTDTTTNTSRNLTPTVPNRTLPDRTPPNGTANNTATQDSVPLWRLYVMRAGYLIFGGGLAVVKWPMLFQRDQWTLTQGVIDCMLIALSVLALLGLRYPLQMLPVLLFESAWKLTWLSVVSLPMWLTGQLTASYWAMTSDLLWVVIILAVIPWRYVAARYVAQRGERWRPRSPRPVDAAAGGAR